MKQNTKRLSYSIVAVVAGTMWLLSCDREEPSDPSMSSVPVARGANDQLQPPPSMAPGQGDPAAMPSGHPPLGTTAAGMPSDHPPMGQMGGSQGFDPGPPMEVGSFGWSTPASWVQTPPSSQMRLVQWQVGADNPAGAVDCSILRFRGGGTTQDNLARWASQFSQPDGGSSLEAAVVGSLTVNELAVTTFELSGTLLSRGMSMAGPTTELPDYAIHSAVVDTRDGPYFLKCAGPEATITAERESIIELIRSFRFED